MVKEIVRSVDLTDDEWLGGLAVDFRRWGNELTAKRLDRVAKELRVFLEAKAKERARTAAVASSSQTPRPSSGHQRVGFDSAALRSGQRPDD